MILISGFDVEQINSKLELTDIEKDIVNQKKKSQIVYHYDSLEALKFELIMRTGIVESARALEDSDVGFAVFKNSRCNTKLWTRTVDGGFRLKDDILPSDGISDIYQNGHLYAFECATAMVIILYKATLGVIHKDIFNAYFKDLFLRDWHYDSNLQLRLTQHKNEAYIGDIVYFKNPDHDPKTPEWQGENAVMLAADLYFGHGIGIRTSEQMIAALNRRRIPGSTTSAYFSNEVVHPDFEYVRKLSITESPRIVANHDPTKVIMARIGTHMYIHTSKVK